MLERKYEELTQSLIKKEGLKMLYLSSIVMTFFKKGNFFYFNKGNFFYTLLYLKKLRANRYKNK
jgi:hypothetical protein